MPRDLDTLRDYLWQQFETTSEQHARRVRFSTWNDQDFKHHHALMEMIDRIIRIECELHEREKIKGGIKGLTK